MEYRFAAAKSRAEYREEQTTQVTTLRIIRIDEDLFADCGMNYLFEQSSIRTFYK